MALGAQPGDVGRMIGRQSLLLVAIGVTAGLGAAWEAGPAIRSLLYVVTPSDGAAFGAAAGFVVTVSALATVIPRGAGIKDRTGVRTT